MSSNTFYINGDAAVMILSKAVDKLYLQRDSAKDVAIDLPMHLPQHQLDGIRFLFRLYKKKAPGVILNDPSGYGKCLQMVLFLNAVRPTLKKPILILSNSANNWVEHFKIWSDCSDDLAVEASNPYSKKQVFVNPVKDGAAFSRRSWGIIVLHDEDCTGELLKLSCNADFKIWATPNDLKNNLYTLASIYEWLHPNHKFNVNQFTAKKGNKRDVVEKALLLDAFLEDFLIRRTDFLTPFAKAEIFKPSLPSPVKVIRKNKDPTGTKVKRSKKRRIEDDDEINIIDVTTSNKTINKNNNVSNNTPVSSNADNNMDVESFIRNEKPIESEEFNFIQNTNKNAHYDDDVGSVNDTMGIDFNDAVNELVENEKSLIHSRKNAHDVDDTGSADDTMGINFNDAVNELVQNEKSINQSSNDDSHVVGSLSISQGEDNVVTHKYLLDTKENGDKDRILVPATEESCESENTAQNYNISKYIEDGTVPRKQGVVIPETESESEKSNIVIRNTHSVDKEESMQANDWKIEDENHKNEKSLPGNKESDKTKSINGNKSGVDDDNTNSNKDLVKKKSQIDEIDKELAEFEAKALKKFKNSILDSIF